ncbi:hypothetical protein AN639_10475 [Candidatus Epulonipiscium fishelsonii]|uniref:Uncharacterized protein n=1 Tax=Candidatus Epulonipiscium fishelsonii TaxID=77094 RepID=A0ACC8XBP9_9FIRM|nr:hypothetical protein AN396_07065 [Epulopiscium sp. SCG-B11WGA-EpuloA1]ONI43452.1 hypothetical protein AN639_10475 [Epulopiscium sp. SCG-B05WGA-EpuloA1]
MIRILDTHTINKIAAGEVIERPASVVKELIENSIDAKATSITVDVKNGGLDLIRITDNGSGIKKDEMETAFLRHATSKITSAEDLQTILSLGFRGEALASIASVSYLEMISKISSSITGKKVVVEGGEFQNAQEISASDGTSITMKNLFYNVPARKAFLKSNSTEGAKITDYMYKLALANPNISFKYFLNNKSIFQTSGSSNLQTTLFQIYGKNIANQTLHLEYSFNNGSITGLLGKPAISRGNRNHEHFFINGRYIKSKLLQEATEQAYKTLTMAGKYPFLVLHLNIDPTEVDINVHPAKLEIRFKNIDVIYNLVYESITSTFNQQNIIPSIQEVKKEPKPKKQVVQSVQMELPELQKKIVAPNKLFDIPVVPQIEDKKKIQPLEPLKEDKKYVKPFGSIQVAKEAAKIYCPDIEKRSNAITNEPSYPNKNKMVYGIDYKVIGQLFDTYWLIQHYEMILLMDQHAAHERIMYESYLSQFNSQTIHSQQLITAQTLHFSSEELCILEEKKVLLHSLGFIYEQFGENDIIIREVPIIFNKPIPIDRLKYIIDSFISQPNIKLYSTEEEYIIRIACKNAIRGKDKLTALECQKLIEQLLMLENPYTCPHGRPTLISLTKKDIEKIFKRI